MMTALSLAAPLAAKTDKAELRPVGAVVNGSYQAEPGLLLVRAGQILVRISDLRQWGLSLRSDSSPVVFRDEEFAALDSIPGVKMILDPEGTNLLISADEQSLPHRVFEAPATVLERSEAVPAQFFGYDLTLSSWQGQARLSGFFDAGMSGQWGSFGTTALLTGQQSGLIRLDTAWRRDFPDRRLRLVVGDAVSQPADWSQPVRFGGIQFGTDFALDPQTIKFPLPSIGGSAAAPSTIELLSEAQRQSFETSPGSFDVVVQPRLTGAGQVIMTIRDATGNVREVTRNFYTSPDLLKPGLAAFTAEAGLLREDYGFASQRYGHLFAAFGLRQPLANWITGQSRIETGGGTTVAGLGSSMVIGVLGDLSLSGAVSRHGGNWGQLIRVQARRIAPRYSLSASIETASKDFRLVGQGPVQTGGHRELVVAGGVALGPLGNLSVSHASLRQRTGMSDQQSFAISALSFSRSLAGGYLGIGMQRMVHSSSGRAGPAWSWFATYSRSLGPRSVVSLNAEPGRYAAIYDHDLPDGTGLGGRMLAGRDNGQTWLEGTAAARTVAGDLDLKLTRRNGSQGVQLSARGALVHIDNSLLAAPRLDNAFALVDVASDNRVTVLLENRPQARRARNGHRVIITGLQPYAPNRVGIDAADLLIEDAVTVDRQLVIPGWRQAAVVRFGTERRHPALIRLQDSAGLPIALGGLAAWPGGSGTIGHDGAVWIDDYQPGALLTAAFSGQQCQVQLPERMPASQLTEMSLTCTPFIEAEPVL